MPGPVRFYHMTLGIFNAESRRLGSASSFGEGESWMIRAFVLYESEPDPERYERHAELCRQVPGGTFRHGKVFGAPMGEPAYAYYAEWEFADREAFDAAARSEEFMATGKDAMEMGGRFHVLFAEVS
jgi:hypothetical protein